MSEYEDQLRKNRDADKQSWEQARRDGAGLVNAGVQGAAGLAAGIAEGTKQLGQGAIETAKGVPAAADHLAAQAAGAIHDGVTSVPVVGGAIGAASGAMLTAGDGIRGALKQLGGAMQQKSEEAAKKDSEMVRDMTSDTQTDPNGIGQQERHAGRQLADEPEGQPTGQAEDQLQA